LTPASKAAEEALKDIGKATYVAHVLEAYSSTSCHTCFAEAVVTGAYFWLREHLVSSVYFLKALLGSRFFVHVRVILPGGSAVGKLNFFFVCVTRDTQNFVVITGHRALLYWGIKAYVNILYFFFILDL
jgi:hypothetical protein